MLRCMKITPLLIVVTAVAAAGVTAAQPRVAQPDDPAIQAERLSLERERWRAGQDEREATARADQRRTDAVLYGLQLRRGPVLPPASGPQADLGPLPELERMDQQATGAARERTLDAEARLDTLRAWLEQTRQP